MASVRTLFQISIFFVALSVLFSVVNLSLAVSFMTTWGSTTEGLVSNSEVTFKFPVFIDEIISLGGGLFATMNPFNTIYGLADSLEIGDEEMRYTVLTAKHGIGIKVNDTLYFPLLRNTDGLVAYFSSVGTYFASLVFAQYGVIIESDERIKDNITNTDTRESLSSLLDLTPKSFKYNETWLEKTNLTDSYFTGITGQDLESVKPQYVINQKLSFGNTKVNDFKTIRYDFLIGDLVASIKEIMKISTISSIRNLCYITSIIGNTTISSQYSTMCNCFSGSSSNETCICEALLTKCSGLSNSSLPICFDNDPSFLYCSINFGQ
jgi:hypothetical protein